MTNFSLADGFAVGASFSQPFGNLSLKVQFCGSGSPPGRWTQGDLALPDPPITPPLSLKSEPSHACSAELLAPEALVGAFGFLSEEGLFSPGPVPLKGGLCGGYTFKIPGKPSTDHCLALQRGHCSKMVSVFPLIHPLYSQAL